ncbi:MAG: N-acetylneuraminate synthase family protein [Pseudomonadota bacterium]
MSSKFRRYSPEGADSYIIAEVGQNHCGSLESALEHVRRFSDAGADAVKFQMRSNRYLFSKEAYNNKYNSENSFGETYGEHREALELSIPEIKQLRHACHEHSVDFIVTPFDEPSLNALVALEPDAIKVASFDLGNLPFLKLIAKSGYPVVVSVGGGAAPHIEASIDLFRSYKTDLAVLHCVSRYPCPAENLRLTAITHLLARYPDCAIGLSDHFNGISSGVVGYMLGARVFEKHVTLNRAEKGTDQAFSLEPEGFRKFSRDIRRTPVMLRNEEDPLLGKEPVFQKLGKSVVAAKDLQAGATITHEDLSGRIFPEPILPVRETYRLLGSKLVKDMRAGEPLTFDDFQLA